MSKYAQLFDNFEKSYKVLKTGIVEELPEKIDLQEKIDSEVPNCLSVLLDKYLALDGAENFLSPVTELSEEDTEALVDLCGSNRAERMLLAQMRLDDVRELLNISDDVSYTDLIHTIQTLKFVKKEVEPDVQNPTEPKSE